MRTHLLTDWGFSHCFSSFVSLFLDPSRIFIIYIILYIIRIICIYSYCPHISEVLSYFQSILNLDQAVSLAPSSMMWLPIIHFYHNLTHQILNL